MKNKRNRNQDHDYDHNNNPKQVVLNLRTVEGNFPIQIVSKDADVDSTGNDDRK